MRLVITVLFLMVLPTALLSLLAGRSISAREFIFEQQLRDDAIERLDLVVDRVDDVIDDTLLAVAQMFKQTVLAGRDIRRLDDRHLMQACPERIAQHVFLFMNPVGFIYPDASISSNTGRVTNVASSLLPKLVNELAMRDSLRGRTVVDYENRFFIFLPLDDYQDLYGGIEVDPAGMGQYVSRLLDQHSTRMLQLILIGENESLGWSGIPNEDREIVISDSFGNTVTTGSLPEDDRADILVKRHLPIAGMGRIGALIRDAKRVHRAQVLQGQLVKWGVLLLVLMIIGSAVTLVASAQRQIHVARRRTNFIAGMSHDLRTPVAAMRVMAESLQNGRVTDPVRKKTFLDAIVNECDRLVNLIERIMFYFRQEQGMLKYAQRVVHVDVLTKTIVERIRRQHPDRVNIAFSSEEESPPILGDANALEQAITNLLDNAVKYGQRQSAGGGSGERDPVHITVTIKGCEKKRKNWTVIRVRDRGPGIAEEDGYRIFGRFYRGQGCHHAHRGGFGLGLSMVDEIMKAHRGRTCVSNASDGGAVFELWLPRSGRGEQKSGKEHGDE